MRTGSASHPRLPGRGAGLHPKAARGWGDAETPELMLLQQAQGKTGASSELLEEKKKVERTYKITSSTVLKPFGDHTHFLKFFYTYY